MPAFFLHGLIIEDIGAGQQDHAPDRIREKWPHTAIERHEIADIVAAPLDSANYAERRAAATGSGLHLEHIVEAIADNPLRPAPHVGDYWHDALAVATWQWLKLENDDILLDVQRSFYATDG